MKKQNRWKPKEEPQLTKEDLIGIYERSGNGELVKGIKGEEPCHPKLALHPAMNISGWNLCPKCSNWYKPEEKKEEIDWEELMVTMITPPRAMRPVHMDDFEVLVEKHNLLANIVKKLVKEK